MSSLPLANQVRQLYVVDTLVTDAAPANVGELRVLGETGKFLYFQHFGQGGLTASDKIDVSNIRYVKQTAAADMYDKLKSHTIQVTAVEAGQVYEVKVLVHNYIGQGAYDYVYRLGTYKAKTGDTAANIAAGLAADLQGSVGLDSPANASDIKHYKEPLFTVTVASDTITITEVNVPALVWDPARFPVAYMPVEITLNGIVTDDDYENFAWAVVSESVFTVDNGTKKLAELEYHCMGNRSDIYRQIGWPRTLDTKYMVDLNTSYDVVDLHYFFQGQGNSVQQSEKEITLVVPAGNESILSAIETLMGSYKIVAPETYPKDTL